MWGWGGKRQRKEEAQVEVECSTSAAAAEAVAQDSAAAMDSPEPGTPGGALAAGAPPEEGGSSASAADIEAASVRAKALYFDSLIQGRTQRLQQQQVGDAREEYPGPYPSPTQRESRTEYGE